MTDTTGSERPDELTIDPRELLIRLCIDDPRLRYRFGEHPSTVLDSRTAALVRMAALIAAAAPPSSLRAGVDDAIASGASTAEIVGALEAVVAITGLPRAVAAAPAIAATLGFDDELADQ
ncbi:carboxymuconolactone decarboxylase family protein [Microbacterium sp. ASV49]|uniref:Carboxymuconolactone decarboxylase-like domain-containing protein n=1 Tax=Microbacterium candidum TaxID=3041922 RepID=A0ABT7MX07_9MICO|nr:carboxymuconolactone decarboxylase family protein [Microbacterium sp. ASV49]MDL9978979.1 hypothetical protein [Microbacterium sp. ASV49]